MELLSFYVDGDLYAADVKRVEKVARNIALTPVPAAPAAVAGIANTNGGIITLLDLSVMLNCSARDSRNSEDRCGFRAKGPASVCAVVFKSSGNGAGRVALIIDRPDRLISVEDDIRTPAEIDGKLYRIIDVDSIVK